MVAHGIKIYGKRADEYPRAAANRPMEFVVKILVEVFFKSEAEAETLMLQVHHSDKAVVGIYSYDVATSKVNKATNMAREAGFPLRLTVEPEKE